MKWLMFKKNYYFSVALEIPYVNTHIKSCINPVISK